MNHSRSTRWLLLAGLLAFAGGVAWLEISARAEALHRVRQHARAIAPALWNLDPRLAADYVRLAAESYGYETIAARTGDGTIFLSDRAPALGPMERALDRLGLLPRVAITTPIEQEGRPLGTLSAVWISRTIFAEGYLLAALILLAVLAERSLRVVEGKHTLERRVVERTRQLAESEARHRQLTRLLDLSPDTVFVRESSGEISYCNEGARRAFGPGDDAAVAARLRRFYETALPAGCASSLATLGTWSGELDAPQADGASRRLHASVSLTPGAAGEGQRVLFIATDITERKNLEAHLLRAQRAQAVGTLASGVAHDFNNLLTPILLSAQMLRLDPRFPDASRSTIATVEQCARRGAELVRQLLNLSGNRPAHRAAVHLPDLLRDVAQLIRGTFPKTVALTAEWPPKLPLVEADPTNLHQAILNLCVNARDAMPEGGSLWIRSSTVELTAAQRARRPDTIAPTWLAITVADSGTGIPSELFDKIFEPFFTTKDAGRGTGLGLATVQGIAHSHGGFVEVQSTVGRGSTFTLFLPAQPESAGTDADNSSRPPPPPARGELILLVDDESVVLETTARMLENAGYRTLCARSGGEALHLLAARREQIRAVVTDLMMPGMDGIALIQGLRREVPAMPVAVMTGLLNPANREKISASGIDATLAKPFRAEELLWCVHQLVRSNGRTTA